MAWGMEREEGAKWRVNDATMDKSDHTLRLPRLLLTQGAVQTHLACVEEWQHLYVDRGELSESNETLQGAPAQRCREQPGAA